VEDVIASAPGRVNLIGEHLDYNGGRCLPIALPQRTTARVRLRDDGRLVVTSPDGDATAYVAGVRDALGIDSGLDVALSSAVPVGSGLSSSAALECSVAVALDELLGLGLDREALLAACLRAETEYVGAPTGGLDQSAAMLCAEETALLLDFATGSREPVAFAPEQAGLHLLVIDTRVRHSHVDGGYGDRRSECARAAELLGVEHLALAGPDAPERLDGTLAARVRHVVSEQARVDELVAAVRSADWAAAGSAMTASHVSLRDDFEVSCRELDAVVDAALAAGALGARMTGGGFGGSAIALTTEPESVRSAVSAAFETQGWAPPAYLDGHASGPARLD
jgi:galactokinase